MAVLVEADGVDAGQRCDGSLVPPRALDPQAQRRQGDQAVKELPQLVLLFGGGE
ncbi:hypothetical protein V5P93_003957 [Actinokineospora auranticolor]|uniref:hypothetical protein n=1 Tax=Actinokineospora auranticolor TaxID=155976 RepID=UPI0015E443D9|nr:hypothetical protein [Actinokineospora auranticolor]